METILILGGLALVYLFSKQSSPSGSVSTIVQPALPNNTPQSQTNQDQSIGIGITVKNAEKIAESVIPGSTAFFGAYAGLITYTIAFTIAFIKIAKAGGIFTHYGVTVPGTYAVTDPEINYLRKRLNWELYQSNPEYWDYPASTGVGFIRTAPTPAHNGGTGTWIAGPLPDHDFLIQGSVPTLAGKEGTPADSDSLILGSLYMYAFANPSKSCPYNTLTGSVWFINAWPEIAQRAHNDAKGV